MTSGEGRETDSEIEVPEARPPAEVGPERVVTPIDQGDEQFSTDRGKKDWQSLSDAGSGMFFQAGIALNGFRHGVALGLVSGLPTGW